MSGAAVGQLGSTLSLLPGGVGQVAVDITSNGEFIAGNSIWRLGENGYQTISTVGFELPANGVLPTLWSGSEVDPQTNKAVFTGSYLDLLTFEQATGFWNEDGALLGTFAGEFQDFEIYEGQLVAGLNSADDGHLLAITDFSTLSILDITGQRSTLAENGLFEGSAGFLLNGPNGPIATTFRTSAVPEPSSAALLSVLSLLLVYWRRMRHFTQVPITSNCASSAISRRISTGSLLAQLFKSLKRWKSLVNSAISTWRPAFRFSEWDSIRRA